MMTFSMTINKASHSVQWRLMENFVILMLSAASKLYLLSVVMLNVIMLSVVMLNVMAPFLFPSDLKSI